MAGGVILPVAAAFAGLEPRHARDVAGISPASRIEHGPGHRPPFRAFLSASDPPSVRSKPVHRRAVDNARGRPGVDAEVVPVDEEDEIGQPKPPCRVFGLVSAPGREPSLTLDGEDFYLAGTRQLQRQSLSDRGADAVGRWAGVVLEEQAFPRHLGVPGKSAAMTELGQHLPCESELTVVWERVTLEASPFVPGPEPFVEHGQRGVDEGDGVPGGQDEAVGEAQPRPAHVPSHRPRQGERQYHVDLRARPARVPALAVIEGQVYALVDKVLQHLIASEVRLGGGKKAPHLGLAGRMRPARHGQVLGGNSWRHLKPPAPTTNVARLWQHDASYTTASLEPLVMTPPRRSETGSFGPGSCAGRDIIFRAMTRLASRMKRLGTESAFAVLAQAQALERTGRRVVHLEIGEPDFATPAHIVEAAQAGLKAGHTHYVPAPGTLRLREAVSAYLERNGRLRASPDRVLITPGAKPIMFFTMLALCEEGDEVLYPNPGFPMYESIAGFVGAVPVPVPLREANDFRMDPEEVEHLITPRTRLLILNSPHNPCGSALTPGDCAAIAEIAVRHDLIVLTDEVYWATRYDGKHCSVLDFDGMPERTVLLDGWSKPFAMTGWRLGFGVFPPDLVEPVTRLIVNSVSCTSAFSQDAAVAALGRALEADRGHGGGVPRPARRDRRGPRGYPGDLVRNSAGRFLRLPQREGPRLDVVGPRLTSARRSRCGLPVRHRVRILGRRLPTLFLCQLGRQHPDSARMDRGFLPYLALALAGLKRST